MRKITLLMLMILAALTPALAQHIGKSHKAMRREVHEFKLKFLAQEMELKEDQQKKFFDLYNQMTDEKLKVYKETKALEKKIADSANASDAEYDEVSKAITAAKEKDADIDKRYDEKFRQFLSSKQIFKMKAAEEKFRQKMHEMRHNKKRKGKK